jgi:arabinogalactan oligomer/maltooligosaccharide transport system permease protein
VLASIMLTDPTTQTLAVSPLQLCPQAFSNNWSIFAAGVVPPLPVMIVFLLLQKYIVGGLISGSVK